MNYALLANCYKNSLALVEINNIQSIAFPCISSGVYSFPHKLYLTWSRLRIFQIAEILDLEEFSLVL